MSALQRIEATCQALSEALRTRDWAMIDELDLACRAELETLLHEGEAEEGRVREKLDALLGIYRQLIEVARDERQSIVDEITAITHAKSAAKVYYLFS